MPAITNSPPDLYERDYYAWLQDQVRAHFDPSFLAEVGQAGLNDALQEAISPRLLSIQVSDLSTVVASLSTYNGSSRAQVMLTVDSRGLISWLRISPAVIGPVPATWAGVDTVLRSVAPQVHLLVAKVGGGSCQPVHSIDPGTAAPLGSAVKLYVLARSTEAEPGYVDSAKTFDLGPAGVTLPAGDPYKRVLLTSIVRLNNSSGVRESP